MGVRAIVCFPAMVGRDCGYHASTHGAWSSGIDPPSRSIFLGPAILRPMRRRGLWHVGNGRGAALRRLMASDAPARANRVSRRCAATKPGWRGTASRRMAAFRKKYVLRSTGLYSDLIVLPAQLARGYSTSNSAHRESLQRSTSIKPGSDCRQSIVSLPCLSFFHEAGFDASSSTSAQCLKGL
jgi:hypothetical protein